MVGGHLGARVSRPIGAEGVAGQGQARRRGGIPASAPFVLQQDDQHRAVRVLLGTVNSGHQRRTEVHATHRSARITWHYRQIPKLLIKN
jgi:hypothetical protein